VKQLLIAFFLVISLCAPLAGVPSANAEDLNDAVAMILKTDNRLKASNFDVDSASQRKKAAFALFYPDFELSGAYGDTRYRWENVDDYTLHSRRTNIRLVQVLFDFGTTHANYKNADFTYFKELAIEEYIRQEVILEAFTAFYKLKQAQALVKYARQTFNNIKKQTNMESARISKGRGYSTDVLQAKAQLLKAGAALIKANGTFKGAENRVEKVFNRSADEVSDLKDTGLFISSDMPPSLKEAEKIALQYSPEIKAAEFAVKVAEQGLKYTKSSTLPKLNGVLESDWREDVGGIREKRHDTTAKLELSWKFNLGLSQINKANAAKAELNAAKEQKLNITKKVLEQVRNAWQNILTADENSRLLRSQEDIAEEFLKLARKERKLGRRTLLDVLNGETVLIEARKEAASAEADIIIHTYSLFRAMGRLVESGS